jgi:predicted DNA-binding transcriptional regulator AlpA
MPTKEAIAPATLTRQALANYLSRSTASVDRDAAAGRLPSPIWLGGAKRWLKSEIDAWLAAGAPQRDQWERMQKAKARA